MVSNGRLTSAGRNIKQSNATTDLCEPGAMRLERGGRGGHRRGARAHRVRRAVPQEGLKMIILMCIVAAARIVLSEPRCPRNHCYRCRQAGAASYRCRSPLPCGYLLTRQKCLVLLE